MKDYFKHYGNIAVTEIAYKLQTLSTLVENEINRELKKMGYKPNTLEWFNHRYIIALDRLRKAK